MKVIRYWGSHFKSQRQANVVAGEFRPMAVRGWQCHLVLERKPTDPSWLEELESMGVSIHVAPRPSRKFDRRCIARTRGLCREIRPDAFICENIHDSPLLGAALARVPVRIWIKRAMNSSFENGERAGLKNRLAITTRLSCALATRVITVSSAVKSELTELGIPAEKLLVLLNPRRLGAARSPQPRAAVRRAMGLADSDVVWISVGHAVPVKGWNMLVRSFRDVADADSRAKLLLVGGLDRPEERATAGSLRDDIDHFGLRDRVHLTGHVEDVASLLRACDGFVMSSNSEGFSNALVEALEAGLPCVATQVGVATDVIRPGINGLLVDRFDEHGLTDALSEVTRNDDLRRKLTANAVAPEAIPTLESYAAGFADLLHTLRFDRC